MWEILDMKCGIIVAYANFNPNKLLVVIYLIYFMSFKRSKCVLSVRLKRLFVKLSKIILLMVIKWLKIGGTPYYKGGARLMIRMIFNRHLRDLMKVIL